MEQVTIHSKPFAFSYSRLKNFETCPRRHHEVDILKNFKEDESEALTWGNEVHKAAENYLAKGIKLPVGMPVLQSWLDKIGGVDYEEKFVEQKLAITRDFMPCEYFGHNAWFRGKADFIGITGPVALAVDWKTGKLIEDAQQLALLAACCFANFPKIHKIRTEFIWLKEGPGVSSREDFAREDMVGMWRNIWPRIEQLVSAHETGEYPPKPGGLCRRYCPVASCSYYRK